MPTCQAHESVNNLKFIVFFTWFSVLNWSGFIVMVLLMTLVPGGVGAVSLEFPVLGVVSGILPPFLSDLGNVIVPPAAVCYTLFFSDDGSASASMSASTLAVASASTEASIGASVGTSPSFNDLIWASYFLAFAFLIFM